LAAFVALAAEVFPYSSDRAEDKENKSCQKTSDRKILSTAEKKHANKELILLKIYNPRLSP
jgi:hypothetical protein